MATSDSKSSSSNRDGVGYNGFTQTTSGTKEPEPINLNQPEEEGETQGTLSRITGAIIGVVSSTAGIVTIIFIVALAGTFGIARTMRKRRGDKKGSVKVVLSLLIGLLIVNTVIMCSLI